MNMIDLKTLNISGFKYAPTSSPRGIIPSYINESDEDAWVDFVTISDDEEKVVGIFYEGCEMAYITLFDMNHNDNETIENSVNSLIKRVFKDVD